MHDDYLLSFLLGIVEGLTEFLPVSSTAHLRLCEEFLHIDLGDGFWKMYSIVIQLGAVLCLPLFFRSRIAKFLSTFPKGERGDRNFLTHPLSLTLVAFVVTGVPGYLLHKRIADNLEKPVVFGLSLLIGGVIMWAVDALCRRPKITHMEEMHLGHAIWIGAVQILSAVFPGTSRSMSTIAAGQLSGMSRESALEFSFFLSIPTMLVATGYELLKTLFSHHPGQEAAASKLAPVVMNPHEWVVLAIGFVTSFVVAFAVVAWFMNWVKRHGFVPFAIYRIVLGIGVLALCFR
jgi:undecaprenyl-diphosphatase